MAAPASTSLFMSLANAWRLLSLRSDIDDIVLELLGRFSLEKIYAEGDKEVSNEEELFLRLFPERFSNTLKGFSKEAPLTAGFQRYQHLVAQLLVHLKTIFNIQRLTLPSESLQIGWYLGFLVSWEVTVRTVEFALQIVVEGRDSLWERTSLRDKYLAEFLFSALRILTLHPKAPTNQRAKDRRERFARIHRSLERLYDSYPGPKSFLLLVCKEITDSLRAEPNAVALPARLRFELPNLATDLYPLPSCLESQYVSTIVQQDGFGGDWLSQYLALRDVSQFVVGASVQYTVNRETREIRLQSSSARTRNAVLHALDNIRIPGHLSKADLFSTFSEIFRIILPDTPSLIRRNSAGSQGNETEMDAIDSLCARLNDRQIIHRISDRQMMHNMSEITKNIALLDDPSGQFRTGQPRFYAVNCPKCHFVGESQLRGLDKLKLPCDPDEVPEFSLPPQSKCPLCGEDVRMAREISLARHTWNLLDPLKPSADTINVERHLPTQFQLAPPKETGLNFSSGYGNFLAAGGHRLPDAESSAPSHRPPFLESASADRSRSISQALPSPNSPGYQDTPATELSPSENMASLASMEGTTFDPHRPSDSRGGSNSAGERPFSPDSLASRTLSQPRIEPMTSSISFEPAPLARSRTVPVVAPPEKGKSSWRSKFGSRKDSFKTSGDSSSLSSTTLESQKLEEISLKSLSSVPKLSSRGKSGKNINVYLSQNSTFSLFWTQSSVQIWDVGTSPPTLVRAIATESTCLLAALTKVHLAYIIGTRDQKLTLRILNLVQPTAPVVEYRMPSSLWCRSISVCPKENYVVVGFENSIVRFFKTTLSESPREERLHGRWHKECSKECPPVETLSFSHDGLNLLGSTRDPRNGTIQIYSWNFPFVAFQELSSCRYHVPLHESEDNGVSSAIFRSGPNGDANLICISTWTQSGVPVLIQPEEGHKNAIKTEISNRQGRLGSRIQCAAFSPSGRELALVNDKGHLYQISNLNSSPMDVKRMATSKELTAKSDSFAMTYMTLPDEDAIIMAWSDSSRALGYVKKIPVTQGDPGITATPLYENRSELPGESRVIPQIPIELTGEQEPSRRLRRDSKQ